MSTCHDNALCDTILPITRSSVFGVYNPVKGVTVTKSSFISENPIAVDISLLPSSITFCSGL